MALLEARAEPYPSHVRPIYLWRYTSYTTSAIGDPVGLSNYQFQATRERGRWPGLLVSRLRPYAGVVRVGKGLGRSHWSPARTALCLRAEIPLAQRGFGHRHGAQSVAAAARECDVRGHA